MPHDFPDQLDLQWISQKINISTTVTPEVVIDRFKMKALHKPHDQSMLIRLKKNSTNYSRRQRTSHLQFSVRQVYLKISLWISAV